MGQRPDGVTSTVRPRLTFYRSGGSGAFLPGGVTDDDGVHVPAVEGGCVPGAADGCAQLPGAVHALQGASADDDAEALVQQWDELRQGHGPLVGDDGEPVVVGLDLPAVAESPDGVAELADGSSLAGSTLTMDAAVRNAVGAGVSFTDAIAAATSTPARTLGFDDRGSLAVGLRADLVALNPDLQIAAVMQAGNLVDHVSESQVTS